jgi:hypothetical protein
MNINCFSHAGEYTLVNQVVYLMNNVLVYMLFKICVETNLNQLFLK